MSQSAVLTINIDGAARGNPGPAAFAYVIAREGHPLVEEAGCLGSTTNNIAEYAALVRALRRAADLDSERACHLAPMRRISPPLAARPSSSVPAASTRLTRPMNGLISISFEVRRRFSTTL